MTPRRPRTVVLAFSFGLLLVSAVGCSLAVGSSDIDQGCGARQKWCGDHCVGVDDPAYGCQDPRCQPCPLPNAIPGCDSGDYCYIRQCVYGFAACGSAGDGCETNVFTDESNCGDCGHACGATQVCIMGSCGLLAP